ncbi:MAG: Dam family site-specific DNA-(adenine-N6)-methyltransferase [Pyrinomonadaceae bacterium]
MTTSAKLVHDILTSSARPFLKWAGGKSQLLPHLREFIPMRFNRYIEPFIGGGAMFFLLSHQNSVISDSNEELIITYIAVRDNFNGVLRSLEKFVNDKENFYRVRAMDVSRMSRIDRAARLIYLNKTCFNGLFRVNKKGQFNTPYNGRTGAPFYNPKVLYEASLALQGVEIITSDYHDVLRKFAERDDFVFLDPPYQPIGQYSDFKRYTKEFFYEENQRELSFEFKRLVGRGCKVILTNSAHPFILDLYKDFPYKIVNSKRLISSNAKTRIGEDLIVLGGL